MINFKKITPIMTLIIFGLLIPTFAFFVDVQQYENLNKTTPYINEFMTCYFANDTHYLWDTYNGGEATIVTPNSTFEYALYCCDNCIVGTSVQLTPNSLNYLLDGNVSIDQSYILEYYIGDLLEQYRVALILGRSDPISGLNDMAGYLIILISTIGFPLLATNLYPTIDKGKLFGVIGGLGFFIGVGGAKFYNLFNLGQTIMLLCFGVLVMIGFIKMSGGSS